MICRFCNKELIQGGDKEYETLYDCASNPNHGKLPLRITYVCPDENCIVNLKAKGFWDDYGDFYFANWAFFEKKFTNYSDGYTALDSFASQADTEINKKDENFTIWKGIKYKLRIKFIYKADKFGVVIKRTPKLEIQRRDFSSFKQMVEFVTHFGKTEGLCNWVYAGSENVSMYKNSMKKYWEAVAEYSYSLVNDGQKEVNRYRKELDETYNNIVQYCGDTNGNGFKSIIYGEWQWWKPLVKRKVQKHYRKYIGEKNK